MTDRVDLETITARADAATAGPWTFYGGDVWYGDVAAALTRLDTAVAAGDDGDDHWPYRDDQPAHPFLGDPVSAADAEFIAHAREDIPALLAETAGLRAQRDAALALCDDAEDHADEVIGVYEGFRPSPTVPARALRVALGVQPEPDELRAPEAAKACEGFRWIGQSFASCDGCGQPYWEHTHDVQQRPDVGPFAHDAQILVPITPEQADACRRKWCPTCSGPSRETVGMVCRTCGADYGSAAAAGVQPEGSGNERA